MKIYRLIDNNEMVTHELRVDDEQTNKYYLYGDVYKIIGGENILIEGKPVPEEDEYDYEFVASFSIKWDMCSHWYFYGEDYNNGDCDSYYHLCGASSYIEFMQAIAFATEVAKMNFELADDMEKEFNDITKLKLLEDCRIECIKADE